MSADSPSGTFAPPPRGFDDAEFKKRLACAQSAMAHAGLDALFLTTEPEVRYFTGFLTRFWESPTRPWFLIVPASGKPVAVIPSIGAHLMQQGWVRDIRTWRAPDYNDDGIGLLVDTFLETVGEAARIGMPSALESHLHMPLDHWEALKASLPRATFGGDHGVMRCLRLIKSDAEIAKIETACAIAGRAFARVPEIAQLCVPLSQVFRDFQRLCLAEGADWVPYLAGAADTGGYGDVISPATEAPLADGDVLMLDTGLVHDGYFCDFDRNFAIGSVSPEVAAAHARVIEATAAGIDAARPGVTAADLFHAIDKVATGGAGGSDAGRYGHGLGMQLTEWPSLIPADLTVLEPGMVLTIEPGVEVAPGRMIVHEENIVVTEGAPRVLSRLAPSEIPVIR